MGTSKTYLIAWDESLTNSLNIEQQLSGSGLDYLFYNVSSRDIELPNWVRAEDIRYFGHFYNALKDFIDSSHSVFIFNAGDIEYDDYVRYTKETESIFNNDKTIGLLAPRFTRDSFDENGSYLFASKKYPGLFLSTMTNGIWVAMSREVALMTLVYYNWAVLKGVIRFPEMRSGWGLDIVYSIITILANKKIYRDNITMFYHPEGSSYDPGVASQEMTAVVEGFYDFAPSLGFKRDKVVSVHNVILKKVQQREHYRPSIDEVYLNLDQSMEY